MMVAVRETHAVGETAGQLNWLGALDVEQLYHKKAGCHNRNTMKTRSDGGVIGVPHKNAGGGATALANGARYIRLKPSMRREVAQTNGAVVGTATTDTTMGSAQYMDHENDHSIQRAHNYTKRFLYTVEQSSETRISRTGSPHL